jgi:ankyrin repeat protein
LAKEGGFRIGNAQNDDGHTPADKPAGQGKIEVVDILISKDSQGPNLGIKVSDGAPVHVGNQIRTY